MITLLCAGMGLAAPASTPATSTPSAEPTVKHLWDYSKELGLSDKQVKEMKSAYQDMENSVKAARGKLTGFDKTLNTQIYGGPPVVDIRTKARENLQALDKTLNDQTNGNAPLADIKNTLQQIADIKIQLNLYDIQALRTVNNITGGSSLDDIKKTLQQVTAVQIDTQVAEIGSLRKINGAMTAQQLSKWHAMQQAERTPPKN